MGDIGRIGCLLLALLVLLNIGGVAAVVLDVARANGRWFVDLVTLVALNVLGMYLLRLARDDG